jgi:hypothetical protein
MAAHTLPSSGALSFKQIATNYPPRANNTPLNLNDLAVCYGFTSGNQVSISNFYGRTVYY